MIPCASHRTENIKSMLKKYNAPASAMTQAEIDRYYMQCALKLAEMGASVGEVPVGAVLVRKGEILWGDYNGREETKNALYHAEMSVISRGCALLGGWRLSECTLYVTVEPCPMCAGAIWNARLHRVVIGTKDARAGAMGSILHLNSYPLNWKPEITYDVCAEEARSLMQQFFLARRK